MLNTYLNDAAFPPNSRVLEIGCGTGAVTRVLATRPGVAEAIGVDPSPVFVAKARERIGVDTAAAFKAEARRRVSSGEYFGHIAYMSLVARKRA